jgi:protein MpaA
VVSVGQRCVREFGLDGYHDVQRAIVLMVQRASVFLLLCVTTVLTVTGCSGSASNTATTSDRASAPTAPLSTSPMTATSPLPNAGSNDWRVVGTSVQGRPIRALTLGHGPREVLFIGGIHGDEAEGAYTTSQLPTAFDAAGLADGVTLTILEDANPDGRAAATRGNANGVDVNRNFPATNFDTTNPTNGGLPLSQPEARTLVETINRVGPKLVLVAHSWSGRHFVNFDGPAREVAEHFSHSSGLPVEESNTSPRRQDRWAPMSGETDRFRS